MSGEVNITGYLMGRLIAGSFGSTSLRGDSLTTGTWERLKCLVTTAVFTWRLEIDWVDTLRVKPGITCLSLSNRGLRR